MSSSLIAVRDDSRMSSSGPRSGTPTSRRSFTRAQKLDHLAAYEVAVQNGQGGAYLRSNGLYSSLISEWRRLRGAGVLAGKDPRVSAKSLWERCDQRFCGVTRRAG